MFAFAVAGTKSRESDLLIAVNTGNLQRTRQLVTAGADVNASGSSGNIVPVAVAAWNGDSDMLDLLNRNGANAFSQSQ